MRETRVVTIRNWDDMEEEFGLDKYGDILVSGEFFFATDMADLCGQSITVEFDENGVMVFDGWAITEGMIEY